jgi:hypothetical protein
MDAMEWILLMWLLLVVPVVIGHAIAAGMLGDDDERE